MCTEAEDRIADIVKAAGGRLVSRIRLQKIAYLLDQLGAKGGFNFSYHHYGPYSREADSAVLDAEAFGLVTEDFDRRQSDGARYSIFNVTKQARARDYMWLQDDRLRQLTKTWAETPAVILELAATAHWLVAHEKVDDWEAEIKRRKGTKTASGRLDKALAILKAANLPPGT